MASYRFYSDPSHGWLKVPRIELGKLKVLDKVSSFSYQKGIWVYLEEDCDVEVFIQAKRARGEEPRIAVQKQAETPSRIRGYEHFHLEGATND